MKNILSALLLIFCLAYFAESINASINYSGAEAVIKGLDDKKLGKIVFSENAGKIKISGTVSGLNPNSKHAIHIHEAGTCVGDFSAAGSHYDPTHENKHGTMKEESHYGDLGNLKTNSKGIAKLGITSDKLFINVDRHSIVGRSIIIHNKADDFSTQPSGNSGKRIACGVIEGTNKLSE